MEGLGMQTTEADETALDFGNTEETTCDLKGATKKDRKDLFQINTHPATVLAANNKRDRRLKQIVMRVVAFCKKEHEEGLQIPFRFFKKRASLMTGVSLSTIHRIETIDMQLGDPDPAKVKKEGAAKDKPKKKKKKKKKENVEVDSGGGGGGGGCGGGNVHAAHVTGSVHPPAVSVHTHVPCAVHANLHANGVQTANVAAVSATANGAAQLFQYSDLANMASQIHFQTLPAVSLPQQLPIAPHPVTVPGPDVGVKQEKRRRKKAKLEETVAALSQISTNGNTNKVINNSSIQQSTANIITKNLTNIQPAALHSLAGVTGGTVTTINVHNAAATLPTTDRTTAPCTWTTGPLGPFTMGDLRDAAGHQLQVGTSHVQVGAQSVPVGTAIPVNAQLQPISVSTAMGTPQTFTGHIDTSNWPPGTVGPFGTLQGTATLVGQQVLQAYQNNINSNHPVSIVHHQQQQQQQQQQQTQTPQSSVFYQF